MLRLLPVLTMLLLGCLPPSDPYPYEDPDAVVAEAEALSDDLEAYIESWVAGTADAAIPDALIPTGVADSKDFYLKDADTVTPEETWATRLARPINQDSLLTGIPDPNITYLFLGTALAPFGSKLVIEGEFPHARFFSVQITPPLDGRSYYADRQFGGAEVSIVDADIEPLPGHTNPYRIGADRTATERSYRLEFDLTTGDPDALNPEALSYPYRKQDNRRTGALWVYQGPLGFKTVAQQPVATPGKWNLGAVWIRIYRPDDGTGPLGGVPLPRVHYELPSGERYFIGSDFSQLTERADQTSPNQIKETAPNANFGPRVGWYKSWGITRSMLNGICQTNDWSRQDSAARVRAIDLGWTGRGANQPGYLSIEPHATTNNYINYLGRTIDIPSGHVAVLTGKMPHFPATGQGQATMRGGQVRYWSMTGIDVDPLSPLPATAIHSVSDEEVALDEDRNYIIAYSNAPDRPENAISNNGITWVNSGTQTSHGLLLRWLSVRDGWYDDDGPTEPNLTFATSDWSAVEYDSTLVGINWRQGHMRCFQPQLHLLTVAEFEALGAALHVADIPVWVDDGFEPGAAESRLGTVTATSLLDASANSLAANALDGNISSVWASAFNEDVATITLDLDSVRTISAVKLLWDFIFYAKDYRIEYAGEDLQWETLATVTDAPNGGIDVFRGIQGIRARYLRIVCSERNSSWYALAEFEVYTSDCDCDDQLATAVRERAPITVPILANPNPSGDQVRFALSEGQRATLRAVEIYDGQGRRVRTDAQLPLSLADLDSGIYFVRLVGTDWQQTVKVMRQ